MTAFIVDDRSIRWRGSGETLRIEAWGEDSLRVRAWRTEVPAQDWALLPPSPSDPTITVDGDVARIENGAITAVLRARAEVDGQTGYLVASCSVEYLRGDGTVLLRELSSGGSLKRRARHWRPITGSPSSSLTASFEAHPDEHLSGMGQYQQALIDLKGSTLELAHRNSQASVPFLLSDRGYGLLWNNPAIGRATFATNRTEFTAEATSALDYWITAGATPGAISRRYADATGHAPVMPEHGLGFWQCKLRYWNQEQLLEVAREHHRRGIPIDVIVADFFHWPELGDYRFEDEFWPDPAGMVRELDAMGIKLMVSIWPQVSARSENFDRFVRENLLVTSDRGMNVQMAFGGPSAFLDVTNPDARAALWELCKANYHDLGIELFWLDEAEPEFGVYDFENYRYHSGSVLETGNAYPLQFSRAFWEGQRAAGQEQIVNLVRCAWAGSQRFGALVWSGDIQSSWDDLRAQIVAGIHIGVAGIPWFTTDIGGFHGGDPSDPAFRELLVRWFQFGTFCPVMRLHGDRRPTEEVRAADGSERLPSGADNEIWTFGDASPILAAHIDLRERLRDYSRDAMLAAHEHGTPVMRGLFYEFPDDATARGIADQYLYGPDLLVCPVLEPGARSRRVYLPGDRPWWDLRTGDRHEPGTWIDADAPLESMPVMTRDRDLVARLR